MNKPNYAIECANRFAIIIRDLGPWHEHPTITNDAANVVRELAPQLLDRRLYYFDSEGELDELVVRDGRFAGFRIGPRVNVLEEKCTCEEMGCTGGCPIHAGWKRLETGEAP